MGIFKRKPNVKSLARAGNFEGLVAATRYEDLMPDPSGTADLGIPTREAAIQALGALGPDIGGEAVRDALHDPADRVRVAAVRVLYVREDAEALADALGWLPRGERARNLVLHALAKLRRPGSALRVAAALLAASREEPPTDGEAQLVSLLLDADRERQGADELVEELILAMRSEYAALADQAADLAVRLGAISVEPLIAELSSGSPRAASALGEIGDIRALEPLLASLSHPSAELRAASCTALGELRDPAAVEALLRSTRDSEHVVRISAGAALDRIGTAAVVVGVSALIGPLVGKSLEDGAGNQDHSEHGPAALLAGPGNGDEKDQAAMLRRIAQFLNRIEDARRPST